jgi:hypothetical protein
MSVGVSAESAGASVVSVDVFDFPPGRSEYGQAFGAGLAPD